MTRIVRPGGRILISVWALEQNLKTAENRKDCNHRGKSAQIDCKMCSTPHHVESSLASERKSCPTNIETTTGGAVISTINNGVLSKQDVCSKVSNRVDDLDCQNSIHLDTNLVSHLHDDTRTINTLGSSRTSSCDTEALKADDTSETSTQEIQECTGNSAVSRDDSVKLKVNASRNVFEQQDLLIPWHYRGQKSCVNSSKKLACAVDKHMIEQDEQELKSTGEDKVPKVYQRFYHVFKENELEEECRKLDDISVVRCYYDKGNWCVELEKVGNY